MEQNSLPGWWLVDWNEDGVITDADQHPIATTGLPVFNYGLSLGASGKRFDLALITLSAHYFFKSNMDRYTIQRMPLQF